MSLICYIIKTLCHVFIHTSHIMDKYDHNLFYDNNQETNHDYD